MFFEVLPDSDAWGRVPTSCSTSLKIRRLESLPSRITLRFDGLNFLLCSLFALNIHDSYTDRPSYTTQVATYDYVDPYDVHSETISRLRRCGAHPIHNIIRLIQAWEWYMLVDCSCCNSNPLQVRVYGYSWSAITTRVLQGSKIGWISRSICKVLAKISRRSTFAWDLCKSLIYFDSGFVYEPIWRRSTLSRDRTAHGAFQTKLSNWREGNCPIFTAPSLTFTLRSSSSNLTALASDRNFQLSYRSWNLV